MFGVIFIKITSLTRKPQSHVRILIYIEHAIWPIAGQDHLGKKTSITAVGRGGFVFCYIPLSVN